ncbi:Cysteine-rich repeat secretory protein 60 [Hibiscus syriacus]|uniref:Cysteine-rich repeat secretory protein 60 n=1 Tax=Hibiscus syriacus TaxID=106335 RepID=A0A6A3ABW1_HIBSY|nr:plasmodesmata-located protein 7-like [Hibiscus syriacus]KAE8701980.1 Cysteine-rich repeat secretory protein 60 [Hibiscus syriacus]
MAIMATNAMLSLSLSICTFFIQTVLSSSTDSFVFGGCSQPQYTPNSPFESNLNSLLTSLVNSATYSSYNSFTIMGSTPQDVVYGLYQCMGDLGVGECRDCLSEGIGRLKSECWAAVYGDLYLGKCYARFYTVGAWGIAAKRRSPSSLDYLLVMGLLSSPFFMLS